MIAENILSEAGGGVGGWEKEAGRDEARERERARPIGVFDSGIGGLTVVRALRRLLPGEDIFYLGDNARVPYGGKSAPTIERYSLEISGLLMAEGAKMVVVACNTASALALPRLREVFAVPVVGVIGPGAETAVRATRSGRIGVIATKATVASRAYEKEIGKVAWKRDGVRVRAVACPLLVPLIEAGWLTDPVTDQVIDRYLEPLLAEGVDTLVLGCTHYPLLAPALAARAGKGVRLVDSAEACARSVGETLGERELLRTAEAGRTGKLTVAFTDQPDGFLEMATRTLGLEIGAPEARRVQTYALG